MRSAGVAAFLGCSLLLQGCYAIIDLGIGKGVNLGLCERTYFDCKCGNTENNLQVPIRQCTYLLRLRRSCQPCDRVTPNEVCRKYELCAECNLEADGCVSCPQGYYGRWCNNECNCQNGGQCHQYEGYCMCPPNYEGEFCQVATGCLPPEVRAPLQYQATSRDPLALDFKCQSRHHLLGSKKLRCLGSGRWDKPFPTCVSVCPKLGQLENGRILPSNSTSDGNFPIGSSAQFRCDDNHFLIGVSQVRCQDNAQWTDDMPSCQKLIFCNDPGLVKNSERMVVKSVDQPYGPFPRGTTVRYSCVGDYILIGQPLLLCQYDRAWSAPPPNCLSVSDRVVTCETQGRQVVEDIGVPVQILCPESCTDTRLPLYGTVIYTELSSVCKAAIHAGKLDVTGGIVYIVNNGDFSDYLGSDLNGISSNSLLAPGGSFRFEQPPELTQRMLEGCNAGWTPVGKQCVLVSEKSRKWERALDTCHNLGSSLLAAENDSLVEGLADLLRERGVNVSWIGLRRDPDTLRYGWNSARGPARPLQAEPPFDPDLQAEDCVAMVADERGSWVKTDCRLELPFACMYDPTENLKVKCPDPTPVANADIKPKNEHPDGFHAGSSAEYVCRPLFVLQGPGEISCTKDGQWSAQPPSCVRMSACREPPAPEFGLITMLPPAPSNAARRGSFRQGQPPLSPTTPAPVGNLPPGYHAVSSRASFTCRSRYYQLVGSATRRCLEDGTWSGRPATCIPVCGHSDSPRSPFIVNGTASAVGQWPWQSAISRWIPDHKMWFLLCGGALLNERWVLTAAHCLTYSASAAVVDPDKFRVYLGKYYRDDTKDDALVQIREIKEIHVHPDFDPSVFDSDIALIELAEPVELTSRVQPVCLPSPLTTRDNIVPGTKSVATGWGLNENQTYSDTLQYVVLPVVSHKDCEEGYERSELPLTVTENMFCAGHSEGQSDTCSGDSGGPLVFADDTGRERRWVVEGVVSWGSPTGCGHANQLGGFTKVGNYLDWIQQFI